ncbi:hypothetical protein [Streptomyces lunaelactis]|uniref:hypothetical protein n=1 Tax=Streptomyces lunaelactis TaxID=1535768 RepID=UPI001C2F9C15|nr:hypothetical protein [Streptomyces lunaelactis]
MKIFDAGGTTRIPPAYVAGSVLATGAGTICLQAAESGQALAAAATIVVVGAAGVTHAVIRGAATAGRTIKARATARATAWIQTVVNPKDRTAPSGSEGEVIELIRQDPETAPDAGHGG